MQFRTVYYTERLHGASALALTLIHKSVTIAGVLYSFGAQDLSCK